MAIYEVGDVVRIGEDGVPQGDFRVLRRFQKDDGEWWIEAEVISVTFGHGDHLRIGRRFEFPEEGPPFAKWLDPGE